MRRRGVGISLTVVVVAALLGGAKLFETYLDGLLSGGLAWLVSQLVAVALALFLLFAARWWRARHLPVESRLGD